LVAELVGELVADQGSAPCGKRRMRPRRHCAPASVTEGRSRTCVVPRTMQGSAAELPRWGARLSGLSRTGLRGVGGLVGMVEIRWRIQGRCRRRPCSG